MAQDQGSLPLSAPPTSLSEPESAMPQMLQTAARTITLAECPIGLFRCGETLALKTEYGNNEGRIDAYIIESGEFFWGAQPQTIASQRAQLVRPVSISNENKLLSALSDIERLASQRHGGELDDAMFAIRILAAGAIALATPTPSTEGGA